MSALEASASPDTGLVRMRRRVRWGECDPAGVVYTPRFCDYIVEALDAFMERLLGVPLQQRMAEIDLGTPAKAMQFVFHHSLRPDQEFDMRVFVSDIRVRSFDLAMEARDLEGLRLFDAQFSAVCVHRAVRESRPLPAVLRERLEAYRASFPFGNDELDMPP
ncbi:thioesterase [Variovorax sp. WS11]|uniref:acyl-CoA thioesterase n=1 Tax=Variovorax sp. WS11 TaxID=1105204 RepID=UPI000D0DE5A0|nr:thioesterase family protein [Variovorax sp. WS11]NDZ18011.1 acyl-CoA thioesterase [Variovorax sp. WS11]PSL84906.1 thioesterase [Variovorax sp. WS11]